MSFNNKAITHFATEHPNQWAVSKIEQNICPWQRFTLALDLGIS